MSKRLHPTVATEFRRELTDYYTAHLSRKIDQPVEVALDSLLAPTRHFADEVLMSGHPHYPREIGAIASIALLDSTQALREQGV
jgi:hypothetical protein